MVFIKKIHIKGFKSYRNAENDPEFSKKVNIIVGRNGSGKSNLYEAIRFALMEPLKSLRAKDRGELLFKRAEKTELNAEVSIYFDNTDHRFPNLGDEVVIKRAIRKINATELYFINNKRTDLQEVVSLLETAGFSRYNPYYIVQQGKVNALTTMVDSERLKLLKEVAGTLVFEEKKEESLKLKRDADAKLKNIDEVLNYIEERLDELKQERDDLTRYIEVDRDRRCLEYAIYDKQLNEAKSKLKELERQRENETISNTEISDEASEIQQQIREKERTLKQYLSQTQNLIQEKNILEKIRQSLLNEKSKLKLVVKEFGVDLEKEKSELNDKTKELDKIEKKIKTVGKTLEEKLKSLDASQKKEEEITYSVTTTETQLSILQSKAGRSFQYSSKEERDRSLQGEIKEIKKNIIKTQKQIEFDQNTLGHMEDSLRHKEKEKDDKSKLITTKQKDVDAILGQCSSLRNDRNQLATQRKELWREESELETKLRSIKEENTNHKKTIRMTMDKGMFTGLEYVEQIAREKNIKGVHGPLVNLLACDDQFYTAIEVTAGGSLFHVVVDNENIAAELLKSMTENRAGRITFMPLNRLRSRSFDLPNNADASPLIDILQFDPKFRPAFQQVFGRTLLCRNIDVATSYSLSCEIDCVTLTGEQVNKRGALTGGYFDFGLSRIRTSGQISSTERKIQNLKSQIDKIKKDSQKKEVDQQVAECLGKLQDEEHKVQQAQYSQEELTTEVRLLAKEIRSLRDSIDQRKKSLSDNTMLLKKLQETRTAYSAEIGTELLSQLSREERNQLDQLNNTISDLHHQFINASKQRLDIAELIFNLKLEKEKNELQNLLSSNLIKRRDQLQSEINTLNINQKKVSFEKEEAEFNRVNSSLDDTNKQQTKFEDELDKITQAIEKLKGEIEALKKSEYSNEQTIQNNSKNLESYFNKRSVYLQQQEENLRRIRELGSLPSDVYEKHEGKSMTRLMASLKKKNERLKSFGPVNKKAVDQYESFTREYEGLLSRKEELERSQKEIDDFIQILDTRKDSAIDLTLRGVSMSFSEVFKEIEGGEAMLQIVRKDSTSQNISESPDTIEESEVEKYLGVRIEARFSGEEKGLSIEQCSGGQKTLLALCLIFAIQRCDPAPFYLFDEIDSNLDDVNCAAVARMIEKQSRYSQFVLSTFRKESLEFADKFFMVNMHNKESTITHIDYKTALDAMEESEDEESEEESEEEQSDDSGEEAPMQGR